MRLFRAVPTYSPLKRRRQRHCLHQSWPLGTSWIKTQLINDGMSKMFWCEMCDQMWVV